MSRWPLRRLVSFALAGALLCHESLGARQQQLLERVVARVGEESILLTDVNAALGIGLVTARPGADPVASASEQLIERALALAEVARFTPPEPDTDAVEREVARLRANAGAGLQQLMRDTGLDDTRLREMARDNLRLEAYLAQRFGAAIQLTGDEVAAYYRSNPDEFRRNGVIIPFDEAEPLARQRATAARREEVVSQWLGDLVARGEVTRPRARP